MEPEALRLFQSLVERAGGRQRLLLVGEAREGEAPPRALLETFARDLFAEPELGREREQEQPVARRVRVCVGGGCRVGSGSGRPWLACPLLFVLFWASSLVQPRWRRERLRLREILRDVRSHLSSGRRFRGPAAPAPVTWPAVVGVVVMPPPGEPLPACHAAEPAAQAEADARLQLEALLAQVFRERRPAAQETLQAAAYSPGGAPGANEVRVAACRALKAALKLRADGAEAKEQRPPAFLQCLPWGRRSRRKNGHLGTDANNLNEDGLQDPEEGVALTNVAPNGNCQETCGGASN
ncbi:uncharacterized protein C2orf72 homolog isoform X3 [Rhineura floridana]|uniref:uncharacterized protein C2orf72 homolog isoform X3 n=1 Tax=Rhineura floridana TaxID=261503 RepID=UPI002AC8928F|nr:uncharacterized protein C2orf72 homolog isoform X3 [Rhineura floridana]